MNEKIINDVYDIRTAAKWLWFKEDNNKNNDTAAVDDEKTESDEIVLPANNEKLSS